MLLRSNNLPRRPLLRNVLTDALSAAAVWNSLPKTVISSDSVTVFKSSLDIPLLPGFLSCFFSVALAHCLTLTPLKLRPHGGIKICLLLLLLLLLLLFLDFFAFSALTLLVG